MQIHVAWQTKANVILITYLLPKLVILNSKHDGETFKRPDHVTRSITRYETTLSFKNTLRNNICLHWGT